MQRLAGAVCRLLGDCVIEVGRRVLGVQLLGHRVLARVQRRAFLLEVSLAQIAPDDRIVRVQTRRDLQVAASFIEFAIPDFRQPETEPRQRIRLIERDRLLKGFPCLRGLDLRQVSEAKDSLGSRQIGLQRDRFLGGGERLVQVAE